MNVHKKPITFQRGDLVSIHLRKDRFLDALKSKLLPRADGPFKILTKINNDAYMVDIPTDKYSVSTMFNISDLAPYHGDETFDSWKDLPQGGEMMWSILRTSPWAHHLLVDH